MPTEDKSKYIDKPIEKFKDYKFASFWDILLAGYKGKSKKSEIDFFCKLITSTNSKNIIDLGVGHGIELSEIIELLQKKKYLLETAEANEIEDSLIQQAEKLFKEKKLNILIHKADWAELPKAAPPYVHLFDFAYLTGNSLTMARGKTKNETKQLHKKIANNFAKLIKKNGYLFIDSRNYDHIKPIMNFSIEQIIEKFSFNKSVYYHGRIMVVPVYLDENLFVLHYYDKERKIWSKLDLYPIYQEDMIEILSKDFKIEKIYHDFDEKKKNKSLFVQYLARRK